MVSTLRNDRGRLARSDGGQAGLQCSTQSKRIGKQWQLKMINSGAMQIQATAIKKPAYDSLLQVHFLDGAQL